ncbi:MAG: hypothetical protein Q4G39_04570 [Brachymonas sp.]|nr:hypothetical protein [Brachymonas sp.]
MEAIDQLQYHYTLLALGVGEIQSCIDWAAQRLQHDQEGDDLEVVLLAAPANHDEALKLVQEILERYSGSERMDKQLVAGKYVASLRPLYLSGRESLASLDAKLTQLSANLGYPSWLVMLSRNCEYATDMDAFRKPFEQEFEYIASLWSKAENLAAFEARYNREVSNAHDANYG